MVCEGADGDGAGAGGSTYMLLRIRSRNSSWLAISDLSIYLIEIGRSVGVGRAAIDSRAGSQRGLGGGRARCQPSGSRASLSRPLAARKSSRNDSRCSKLLQLGRRLESPVLHLRRHNRIYSDRRSSTLASAAVAATAAAAAAAAFSVAAAFLLLLEAAGYRH